MRVDLGRNFWLVDSKAMGYWGLWASMLWVRLYHSPACYLGEADFK